MDIEKINKIIDDSTLREEMALPIYADHIDNVLFWSGLSEDKKDKIISNLKILLKESAMHAKTFKKIKELINP